MVFHEGDEWGDDEGESIEEKGGELVAERFSSTGWEDCEGRAIVEEGVDDRFLAGAKLVVAEILGKCFQVIHRTGELLTRR